MQSKLISQAIFPVAEFAEITDKIPLEGAFHLGWILIKNAEHSRAGRLAPNVTLGFLDSGGRRR